MFLVLVVMTTIMAGKRPTNVAIHVDIVQEWILEGRSTFDLSN